MVYRNHHIILIVSSNVKENIKIIMVFVMIIYQLKIIKITAY